MKSHTSVHDSCPTLSPPRTNLRKRNVLGPKVTSKTPSILGKGQFSIYLPRRVDSEYYVKSPVKVKAEMFLCPGHLGVGGMHLRTIPCNARAEKLTEDSFFNIVNVPIKIEAEVLLSPGLNYICKTSTPFNGEDKNSQCTVRIIERSQRPYEAMEGWQLWRNKPREGMSKFQAPHHFKADKLKIKGVMVEELKLDDNIKRTKDLSRQLTYHLDQVLEQNKKIQKLQERLREEECKGVNSLEKVHVVEQQYKVLEQKLKAAQCRAKVAEHRAEAIKQRTKILSVSCEHQGVQVKDLVRHIDLFVKNLEAQKLLALDSNKVTEHQVLQRRESLNTSDTIACSTPVVDGFELCTIARTKPFRPHNHAHEIENNVHDNTPDLNSPSTNCFYQTITMQELNNKYVLFLCRRSPIDQQHRLHLDQEDKHDTTTLESISPSTDVSLAFPPMHVELLLNQLLQMVPIWHMEFDSSIQRAQELVKKCVVQAVKLRDLSRDLDCFPSTTRGESTSLSSTSTSPSKGRVKFVEEDVTPSPESTPLSETQGEQAVCLHTKVVDRTNRCLERYLFNLAEAAENLIQVKKIPQADVWIQTIPEQPLKVEMCHTSLQVAPRYLLPKGWLPYRYEVKAWRIAFRTMVQGLLLWLGLLLLPEVSFFAYLPPPT